MADLDLLRGDARTLTISDIKDAAGATAVLAGDDIFRWTARRYAGATTALLAKTSEDGGITFVNGSDEATVHLVPSDFDACPLADVNFVWDVEYVPGGDEDEAVTIDRGSGLLSCDVTRVESS